MAAYRVNAKQGCVFVVTEYGYKRTLDHIKPERAVGKPVKGFEYSVPRSWLEKGYVQEVEEREV